MTEVTEADVARTEPYILFYERTQSGTQTLERHLVQKDSKSLLNDFREAAELRRQEQEQENILQRDSPLYLEPFLLPLYQTPPPNVCFLTKHWLLKYRTTSDPGPIDNFAYLSSDLKVPTSRPEIIIPKNFLPVSENTFDRLQRKFGGGPKLKNGLNCCEKSKQWLDAYNYRRKTELELITRYDTKTTGGNWYLVEGGWVGRWKRYVRQTTEITETEDMQTPFSVLTNKVWASTNN